MLRAGDVVADRYRLIAPLAEGGMGAVWRAEHVELNVEVALKVLLDRVANADGERRFRREAQAAAKLSSPHVVRVHDLGVFEGQPYLAMELLQGEDLQQRIEREGPLPLDRCALILDSIAKAVELAHQHGIIHRDLKPANVFLAATPEGEVVKVLDFGIAKVQAAESNNTTGQGLLGSPAYMSPEQVWSETVEASTDVWSLGVIAFEMVAGQNPFDGGPLAKIFQRIVGEPLPRIGTFRTGLPSRVEAFFERALTRSAADRFPSAPALAAAFRSAIESGESIGPREVDGVSLPAEVPPIRRVDPHARTLDAPRQSSPMISRGRMVRLVGASAAALLVVSGVYVMTRNPALQPVVDAAPQTQEAIAVELSDTPPLSLHPERTAANVTKPSSPDSAIPDAPSVSTTSSSASAQRVGRKRTPSSTASIPVATVSQSPTLDRPSATPSIDPKFGIPHGR